MQDLLAVFGSVRSFCLFDSFLFEYILQNIIFVELQYDVKYNQIIVL